jgi:ABC-type branched-subunit amino acid transport system substrate-binding protein
MSDAIRIGLLRDVVGAGHDFGGNATRLAIDDANARGGVQGRPVELAVRAVERAAGTHDNVAAAQAAWRELVHDEQVLGLIGPSTTPVALAVHQEVEATGVPAIHWAGTDQACGDWHFQFQAGYLPDEGPALAYLMAREGRRRVFCFRGEGGYGAAYLEPFLRAAEPLGLTIAGETAIPFGAQDLRAEVAAARASEADAVVAMGLFGAGLPLARAIREAGWSVACHGNCGFALIAALSAEARETLSGWVSTDMFDPHNGTNRKLLDAYAARYGVRPASASAAFGYDLARLMLEGLRLAPELTRAGLRRGLEQVRALPAATGGAGSWMAFGAHDRLALKGPRLFVFQRITPEGLTWLPA